MSALHWELLLISGAGYDEVGVRGRGEVKAAGLTLKVTGSGYLVVPHILTLVVGHGLARPCRRVGVNGLFAVAGGILIIHVAGQRSFP